MRRVAVWSVLVLLGSGIARAEASEFGTAGPFRTIGGAGCGQPFPAQLEGACDPAPADSALPAAERSAREIERALRLVDLSRTDAAREALDRAVAADPSNADALEWRGRLAMTLTDGPRARADIEAALLLRPKSASLLASRAFLTSDLSDADALSSVNEALSIAPDDPDALWIRSRIYTRAEELESAETDLTRAIGLAPQDRRLWQGRAELRIRLGRFAGAVADSDELIRRSPRDAMARRVRAEAYAGLGDDGKALDDLTAVLDGFGPARANAMRNPAFQQVAFWRAMLLTRLGRSAEAADTINAILAVGGQRAVLRLQVFLRQNGFPSLPIDGARSPDFDDAVRTASGTAPADWRSSGRLRA